MGSFEENIRIAITASHPVVYIQTDEEQKAVKSVLNEADDCAIFSYDDVDGIKWLNEDNFKDDRALRIRVRN